MLKKNDSINSPLHFILENGTTIGQFYNSWDKKYHFSRYVPYDRPPTEYLCGGHGNFSSSRSEGDRRKGGCCDGCVSELKKFSGLNEKEFKSVTGI